MIDLNQWLDQHTSRAPATLRQRVKEYAHSTSGGSRAASLAAAGQSALDRVAADALITLALLAQAEAAPDRLEEFATSVLRTARPGA
jgi:hypothetical protein